MAQVTDRTVGANPSGFDMRTELNNIIAALESDNSGSSEPLNPVAYMKWIDTSNATYYYVKERNHDNTAWVTLFRYTVANKIMEAVSNGVVLQDSALVHKTGNETIAGVKTFSSSPIVPTPTTTGNVITMDNIIQKTAVAIGYGTGAGAQVTQGSSLGKGTPIVLDKPSGSVIMNNAALASQSSVYFQISNNKFIVSDGVVITQSDGGFYSGANYDIKVVYKADGEIGISVKNISASTLSEAVRFRLDLIRGANS